jgi:hypothetical protein
MIWLRTMTNNNVSHSSYPSLCSVCAGGTDPKAFFSSAYYVCVRNAGLEIQFAGNIVAAVNTHVHRANLGTQSSNAARLAIE